MKRYVKTWEDMKRNGEKYPPFIQCGPLELSYHQGQELIPFYCSTAIAVGCFVRKQTGYEKIFGYICSLNCSIKLNLQHIVDYDMQAIFYTM